MPLVATTGTLETFEWQGRAGWHVTAAKALVAGREPNADVDVQGTARAPDANWDVQLTPDQRAWALAHADLSQPVLALRRPVDLPFLPPFIIIDGWHRLYRAWQEGVALLPAHVLTTAEERAIRLWPAPAAGRPARRERSRP